MFRTVSMLVFCALFSSGCTVCCRNSDGVFSFLVQSECPSGEKEFDVDEEEECTDATVCCAMGGSEFTFGLAACVDAGGREVPASECEEAGDGGSGDGGGSGGGSGGSGAGGTGGGSSGGTCSCEDEGVTFSANEGCPWEDREQCSGFHSACEFGSDGVDPEGELADGTTCTLEECTITIHCP